MNSYPVRTAPNESLTFAASSSEPRRHWLQRASLLALAIGLLAVNPIFANDRSDDQGSDADKTGDKSLVGSWEGLVTPDPLFFPPFPVLLTFMLGGGFVVTYTTPAHHGAQSWPAAHGTWARNERGEYSLTWRGFVVDTATGNLLNTFHSQATLVLNRSGEHFTGSGPGPGFNALWSGDKIKSEPLP